MSKFVNIFNLFWTSEPLKNRLTPVLKEKGSSHQQLVWNFFLYIRIKQHVSGAERIYVNRRLPVKTHISRTNSSSVLSNCMFSHMVSAALWVHMPQQQRQVWAVPSLSDSVEKCFLQNADFLVSPSDSEDAWRDQQEWHSDSERFYVQTATAQFGGRPSSLHWMPVGATAVESWWSPSSEPDQPKTNSSQENVLWPQLTQQSIFFLLYLFAHLIIFCVCCDCFYRVNIYLYF